MDSAKTLSKTASWLYIFNRAQGFKRSRTATAIVRISIRTTVAWLAALLLIGASPVQAQTGTVLYNFTGTPDGANPTSRLTFNGGNLYGTTYSGGLYGMGSVFELAPNGNGGWNETLLYSFCPAAPSCTDGQNPTYSYVTFDSNGNLYGTVYAGGTLGDGAVFELSPSLGGWTEKVLYSFADSPDGANPVNGVIMDKGGNIYGTAYSGGTTGNGAVYELSPATGGGWTEQVIYNINSTYAGLTMDAAGNIYGPAYGSIFELSPNGTGGWNPTVIFTFTAGNGATQGSDPDGTLALDSSGSLYGTTYLGGSEGDGTVFKLTRGSKGKWSEKLLLSMGKPNLKPFGGIIFDTAGDIFGTATEGGVDADGDVYELVAPPAGKTGYTGKVVYHFNGTTGNEPFGSLVIDSQGYLYGTTYMGGSSGNGVVFEVNPHAAVTTNTLTSSANPSIVGQAVTFTASVSSSAGPPPDGEVVVFEPIGQSTLTGGVATFTTSILKVGTTNIRAVYGGDLNFISSDSNTVPQVVDKK
jgi:uncharacterized repeat protein (TIGR03803 family)